MPTIAYIANQFPSPVEPYVVEEIRELRNRGVEVIACSGVRVDATSLDPELQLLADETLYLPPFQLKFLARSAWLCLRKLPLLAGLLERIIVQGNESPLRRIRALLHTWLGVYYALLLQGRGVEHIHVHHGYFASWVAMVAARMLGVGFSMTLHGSDLLLHGAFLDTKLARCKFALTVSSYNRRHILEHYPAVPPERVLVQRLGVDSLRSLCALAPTDRAPSCLVMLAVGRLQAVKDHAFLLRACRRLKDRGLNFLCLIAGEGPERGTLERLVDQLDLHPQVELLGHVRHHHLDSYYAMADLVVLTSRSEGIPLVLMEAMARGRAVLAPAITGIPELVEDGKTGFLYRAGSLDDFVARVEAVRDARANLQPIRQAARQFVLQHYNREKNLALFGDIFLARIHPVVERNDYENFILQQI
jgi:glycosyltransferase involved in cell wall biosynthesis